MDQQFTMMEEVTNQKLKAITQDRQLSQLLTWAQVWLRGKLKEPVQVLLLHIQIWHLELGLWV